MQGYYNPLSFLNKTFIRMELFKTGTTFDFYPMLLPWWIYVENTTVIRDSPLFSRFQKIQLEVCSIHDVALTIMS